MRDELDDPKPSGYRSAEFNGFSGYEAERHLIARIFGSHWHEPPPLQKHNRRKTPSPPRASERRGGNFCSERTANEAPLRERCSSVFQFVSNLPLAQPWQVKGPSKYVPAGSSYYRELSVANSRVLFARHALYICALRNLISSFNFYCSYVCFLRSVFCCCWVSALPQALAYQKSFFLFLRGGGR